MCATHYTRVNIVLGTKPRAHATWMSTQSAELHPGARHRHISRHLQAGDTKTHPVDIGVCWVLTRAFASQEDWWYPCGESYQACILMERGLGLRVPPCTQHRPSSVTEAVTHRLL